MKLENRSAIVTGGAKGIGRAVCELFAAEGARVAILDLDAEQGEAAAAGLRNWQRSLPAAPGRFTRPRWALCRWC